MSNPSTPPTINLSGHPVTLEPPPSLFAWAANRTEGQHEVGGLAQDLAFGAAAMRACWPDKATWPAAHRPRDWQPGVDMNRYGFEIFEELCGAAKGRKIPLLDVRNGCIKALNWTVASLLSEEEVQIAADFSEGQEED